MSEELIFVGFKSGKGKNGKEYYMLNFITIPKYSKDKTFAYCSNISIFTEQDKFNNFIKEYGLEDKVCLPFEINGDKVRYYL